MIKAPAKLNLFLHVTGRRADGYHDLESLNVFLTLADRITLAPARQTHVTLGGSFAHGVPADGGNIAARALAMFDETFATTQPFAIHITKNIPSEAGLGGGSADAGAMLRHLAHIYYVPENYPQLLDIADALGADVPMCYRSRPAFARGTGDVLTAVPEMHADIAKLSIVLVKPYAALSTANVFRAHVMAAQGTKDADPAPDMAAFARDFRGSLLKTRNDLLPTAISLAPSILEVLTALDEAEGCWLSRMAGSGTACFGLFEDDASAVRAASSIATDHPEWWVTAAKPVI